MQQVENCLAKLCDASMWLCLSRQSRRVIYNIYMQDYKQDLDTAIRTLRRGGIILYPTDTVWGIGCDASNADAVAKIYELKRRSDSKSMLVLVDSVAELEYLVPQIPEIAYDLVEVATRPLTMIYDGATGVAPNLLSEDGSLGIRVTTEAFSSALCRGFRGAIVSTSANISGEPTPLTFSAISPEIKEAVDYIVGYRQGDKQNPPPSQIIKLGRSGQVQVIRE